MKFMEDRVRLLNLDMDASSVQSTDRVRRIKKQKSFIQTIFFQNLHQKLKHLKDPKKKSVLIQGTAELMKMQRRQVYKWIWDEDLRES